MKWVGDTAFSTFGPHPLATGNESPASTGEIWRSSDTILKPKDDSCDRLTRVIDLLLQLRRTKLMHSKLSFEHLTCSHKFYDRLNSWILLSLSIRILE